MNSENTTAVKGMTFAKKAAIALMALVAVVVIVATSVLATVAYLTSSAAVSNVFTVGNVGIKLTESKVDSEGKKITPDEQVDTNTYCLVPDKTYDKNPTIFVDEGSQDSFLFILVRNDIELIAANEPGRPSIATQLAERGWAKYVKAATGWIYVYVGLDSEGNSLVPDDGMIGSVPAKEVSSGAYTLFETFSIDKDADVSHYGAAKITITAVAIQDTGFQGNIEAAWTAVKAAYPYIHTGEGSN